MKSRCSVLGWIVIAMIVADVFATLMILKNESEEGNPIMSALLARSPWMFVLVKLILVFTFVYLAEHYRELNPRFVKTSYFLAITIFFIIYVVMFARFNF